MQHSVYPIKDATIYERKPDTNTGLDQIIELEKITAKTIDSDSVYWNNNYNSRILLQLDINEIKNLIQNGTVKKTNKYYLNLFSAHAENLSLSYSIYAYAVSQSWNPGKGYFIATPPIKEGVSWTYRDGYFDRTGKQWASSSFVAGTTGAGVTATLPAGSKASLSVNDAAATSGSSSAVSLVNGSEIVVVVTAQDGLTVKPYRFKVTIAA
jgi:hypothetical protein